MRCSCNGVCRQSPYVCPVTRGHYNRSYDPDYGRNMKRFTVTSEDIMNVFRNKSLDSTMKSVVKD